MDKGIDEILKQLPATQYGAALKVFLEAELDVVDSVDGVTTLSEIKGKQIAKKIIRKIFAFYPLVPIDTKTRRRYN